MANIPSIDELYQDLGHLSKGAFYQQVKHLGYTQRQVNEYYQGKLEHQIQSAPRSKKEFYPIYSYERGAYQADIMFLNQYAKQNSNYNAILNFININTKKAYSYPIKNKKADTITEATKHFLRQAVKNNQVNEIATDDGKEFLGSFSKLVKSNGITHNAHRSGELTSKTKMGVVERFNKTVRMILNRLWEKNGDHDWISHLAHIIDIYNDSPHSSLQGKTPYEVDSNISLEKAFIKRQQKKTALLKDKYDQDYHANDTVLLQRKKTGPFEKVSPAYDSTKYKIANEPDSGELTINISAGRTTKKVLPYHIKKL